MSANQSRASSPERFSPPPARDVARPVANLGNTCYMNAVLQTLAHAPELCMAMDVHPHHTSCPIYLENLANRRASSSRSSSPSIDGDDEAPTRKSSRRSSGKRSPTGSDMLSETNSAADEFKFCALCEVERHLTRVHTQTDSAKPVSPSTFVNGFIDHVAPWFKLGMQEDSHEFLRLLIDAMQRSCKQARSGSHENPQDTPPESTGGEEREEDTEYPFRLFRGTVESNVTCDYCKATSTTMDPIEDIGLDVTGVHNSMPPSQLVDVGRAFERFAKIEDLDSGYKCESCGKVGRATKQSRLAAVPPILTLHLKRFRYGEAEGMQVRRSGRAAKIEGHAKFGPVFDLKPYLTSALQEKHTSMVCRLFAVIVHAGKNSHSGHYIAYVRNVSKNEWWKMDDARVTPATNQEVMSAEAYMLFYRVVEHPIAVQMREEYKRLQDEEEQKTKAKEEEIKQALAAEAKKNQSAKPSDKKTNAENTNIHGNRRSTRKRKAPEYSCGEEWALGQTNLPRNVASKLREMERLISEHVVLKPESRQMIKHQASRKGAAIGHGPSSGISIDDDFEPDSIEKMKVILRDLLSALEAHQKLAGGSIFPSRRVLQSLLQKDPSTVSMITNLMVEASAEYL